jgi:hypothetical protein
MGSFDAEEGSPRSRPTPRRIAFVVLVYAVAIGFGVALFSGHFPGLPGQFNSYIRIGGHEYNYDVYEIPFPVLGQNSTSPSPTTYLNVTFWLWVTGWYTPQTSYVHGNGTEANGTSYSFVLGELTSNESRVSLFVSPDSEFAVSWSGGFFMLLLVEI